MPRKRKLELQPTHVEVFDVDELNHRKSKVHVDTVSLDGKRIHRHEANVFTPFPHAHPPSAEHGRPSSTHHPYLPASEFLAWDYAEPPCEEQPCDDDGNGDEEGGETGGRRRGNATFATKVHDAFLTEWLAERDKFLSELHRLEGFRGHPEDICPRCPAGQSRKPEYRCKECIGGDILCRTCCRDAHALLPLHVISRWNGRFFEKAALRDVGVVVQLGHSPSSRCSNPRPGPLDFMVMDIHGLHPVDVRFCACDNIGAAGDPIEQLLRQELYPATLTNPSTVFTFSLLNMFQTLSSQSKVNAYDFYTSLEHIGDSAKLGPSHNRLKSFLRVIREWRHLMMLKRTGRGFEPGGVEATAPGELCLRCPACSRPGYNLPEGWESAPDNIKYVYTLIIAVDANFRLKRRAVSNDERDPPLGSGWGYFVERKAYNAHLLQYVNQEEISNCTGFAALKHANSKFNKGYAQTGCVIAVCARHGFIGPNAVGDLQKGERYCNVDYVMASFLALYGQRPSSVFSYDIACQWAKHFRERIQSFPAHLRVELPEGEVRYAIPKYHFNAHKEKDHNQYSLNLMPGVGRTDGEEPERNWSRHDGAAPSTREMGPGSREDTLEAHFDFANWRKYVDMGDSLQKKYGRAVKDAMEYEQAHVDFATRLDPENVAEWTAMVVAYENDPSQPDPYFRPSKGLTEADIKLKLAEEDLVAAQHGDLALHEVTPSSMLVELLELEDQQRRFKLRYTKAQLETAAQNTEHAKKRSALQRKVAAVRPIQAIYMSPLPRLLATTLAESSRPRASSSSTAVPPDLHAPENQPLFLPSQLSSDDLRLCTSGLADLEERLRDGQLHDSLDKLRVQLHVKSRLLNFKGRHVRHQRPNTAMRRRLDANDAKIIALAEKYRAARRAKLALAGPGEWEREHRPLAREDVRTLTADDWSRRKTKRPRRNPKANENTAAGTSDEGPTEGRRQTSWIWMAADGQDDLNEAASLPGMTEALRMEFLRTRSRHYRYMEEVGYVVEEKRRVIETLEKESLAWDRREGGARSTSCAILRQGLSAYAAKQAAIRRGLSAKFSRIWADKVDVSQIVSMDEDTQPPTESLCPDPDAIVMPAHVESDDEALHLDEAEESEDDLY
ncbi:CxC2 domain-containing protein [Phanerochaete sordida]|uniref:CxC2 domain-containing protein n=1 Tax=Phanerochaete sordida TaxID=48140 RepID=A0A9P3GPL8_9APHY|nr:CxC2 domain-containing protein [Phanerochaete sordida]